MENRDFRLGDWLVRPAAGELVGEQATDRLKPRSLEVLQDLAEHAGEVRTREEILAAVWGDAFVGEEVLSHCIWELRRALRDDSRQPRYIQTLHGRGYRLIAPIRWLDTAPPVGSRYQVGERIGSGSKGIVHAAHDTRLDRPVALKFLPAELSRLNDAKRRFLREARAAAALDHPNVCALLEVGETDDGRLFLIMPRYEGETLKQRLRRGPLAWREAIDITRQLARALAAAHEAGVVHRDVKPSNVFLTDDGRVKLLDFGVAKLADATHDSHDGSSRGTAAYMSPEQARARPVDRRTDLWSLGVVLYEMLSGSPPFTGEQDLAVLYAILNEPPAPLAPQCPDAPSEVIRLVERLLSKEAAERPTAAHEVLAVLDLRTDEDEVPGSVSGGPVAALDPRPRGLLLLRDRVEAYWIDGALAQALAGRPPYPLGFEVHGDPVAHPWGALRPDEEIEVADVPPGTSHLEIFRRFGRSLLILGAAGSGKTVALLRLAREMIAAQRDDPAEPVPVVLQLPSWGDRALPLARWLAAEISRRYYVPQDQARRWLDDGALALLLDGLDEVAPDQRQRCANAINRFRESAPLTPIAVTCRSEDYANLVRRGPRLMLGAALTVQPLEEGQVEAVLASSPQLLERVRSDRALRPLTRSPFTLSILQKIGLERSSAGQPASRVPTADNLLYRFVRSSLRQHGGPQPPFAEGRVIGWLAALARATTTHHRSLFQIEEIQPSWLQSQWRRGLYVAISRLGIGLIVALATASLAGLSIGFEVIPNVFLTVGAAAALVAILDGILLARRGSRSETQVSRQRWIYPLLVALVAAIGSVVSHRLSVPDPPALRGFLPAACFALIMRRPLGAVRYSSDIAPVEAVRWSWRASVKGWAIATAILFAAATILAIHQGQSSNPSQLLRLAPNALVIGLMPALLVGLRRGLVDVRTRPNHGMFLSARNVLLGAALAAIGGLLALSLARWLRRLELLGPQVLSAAADIDPDRGFLVGATVLMALLGAGWLGGTELIKHYVLRVLLWTEGTAPIRYPRFLAHAARCTLLRTAGGGYLFAHASLQRYFASLGRDGR